jgi:hypothetical protein
VSQENFQPSFNINRGRCGGGPGDDFRDHRSSSTDLSSIRGLVLFGNDRDCVNLHERARASVSRGGNDRDDCAVIAPH